MHTSKWHESDGMTLEMCPAIANSKETKKAAANLYLFAISLDMLIGKQQEQKEKKICMYQLSVSEQS